MSNLPENELFQHLTRIAQEVSLGNYENVETIFELTKEAEYPAEVAGMAESIGMMIVRIDAKQQQLEQLIADLHARKAELEQLTANLRDANIGILEVLGSAIAKRDSDTHLHNFRVTIAAIHLGRAVGLKPEALQSLIKGSFLHDLGKIAISDNILLKPDRLTVGEFMVMKSHVTHGCDIIRSYQWLDDAYDVVNHHHEKFDGRGYPDRLAGNHIPLNARIFAVADVFDALVSLRPYKQAFPIEHAIQEMTAGRGSHFDPHILDTFLKIAPELYAKVYSLNEEELAEMLRNLMEECFKNT
jgi:HD-GYP domain-containing protein (c-di-GMP phosphodiesterase class II)